MTINIADNSPRISYTVAQGATQTSFTVPFEFFDNADLNVYIDGTLKTITTHYTVSGGDGSTGTVSMSVTGGTGGSTVVITRDIELERTTDFPVSGAFNIVALNTELDRLIAVAADLDDRAARSIQAQDFDTTVTYTLPVVNDRKGKVLGFNASTGAVEAGPQIADVQSLANISADIATLADIEDGTDSTDAIQNVNTIRANVTTVAGIASNVTSVAGIASNVTSVVGNATNINTVASNIASVNTVATNITSVVAVANDLAEAVSEVETVANDLNEAVSEIDTVATNITNVNTVGGISANVTTVAGISANVTTVAGISANVTTVAGNNANVTTVAGQTTNLQNVTNNLTAIQNAATNANNAASSATAAASSQAAAASSQTAAAASQVAAAASASSAANSFDSFDDRYLGVKSSNPTTDNDGDALASGMLYFSSSENIMKVYDGASWIAATSAGNVSLTTFQYSASGGQTTFSGSDANSATLSYTVNNILVTLNGSLLFNGTDYTATNGTSVVLASGATASDVLQVTSFKSFTTADMVPASTGGTFAGNVAVTGDLTVDTSTLKVDSSNNRVGIGTTSPDAPLSVRPLAQGVGTNNVQNWMYDTTQSGNEYDLKLNQIVSSNLVKHSFTLRNAGTSYADNLVLDRGNVGIGTSSPTGNGWQTGAKTLHINQNSTNGALLRLTSSNTDGIVGTFNNIMQVGTIGSDPLVFYTNGSERMRIDSSGNLLVGKSATNFNTAGIEARSGGTLWATADGTNAASFNRKTDDGAIAYFSKDGTTVGSIGTDSNGDFVIDGSANHSGLRFKDNTIVPKQNGSDADNAIDLGKSDKRWRDLFLSGGVYLGGVGSANKLEDYEEGFHEPTVTMSTSGSVTLNTSFDRFSYTKIGRLVTITGNPRISSVSSPVGSVSFTLPFVAASGATDEKRSGGVMRYYDSNAGSGSYNKSLAWHIQENTSTLSIDNLNTDGSNLTPAASDEFYFCLSYITP